MEEDNNRSTESTISGKISTVLDFMGNPFRHMYGMFKNQTDKFIEEYSENPAENIGLPLFNLMLTNILINTSIVWGMILAVVHMIAQYMYLVAHAHSVKEVVEFFTNHVFEALKSALIMFSVLCILSFLVYYIWLYLAYTIGILSTGYTTYKSYSKGISPILSTLAGAIVACAMSCFFGLYFDTILGLLMEGISGMYISLFFSIFIFSTIYFVLKVIITKQIEYIESKKETRQRGTNPRYGRKATAVNTYILQAIALIFNVWVMVSFICTLILVGYIDAKNIENVCKTAIGKSVNVFTSTPKVYITFGYIFNSLLAMVKNSLGSRSNHTMEAPSVALAPSLI
ncbi:hypothetical protein NECID01_1855 [Nematocida sp. AWRm77]|nr:hypothetical protein NECID01_1855 [Nematocida sp. AWRm77]